MLERAEMEPKLNPHWVQFWGLVKREGELLRQRRAEQGRITEGQERRQSGR